LDHAYTRTTLTERRSSLSVAPIDHTVVLRIRPISSS